jgi:uncharacterized OsmC-like protein
MYRFQREGSLHYVSSPIQRKEIMMDGNIVVRSQPGERFTQLIEAGGHRLFADEPEAYGGASHGPGPYAYLLAALGA